MGQRISYHLDTENDPRILFESICVVRWHVIGTSNIAPVTSLWCQIATVPYRADAADISAWAEAISS